MIHSMQIWLYWPHLKIKHPNWAPFEHPFWGSKQGELGKEDFAQPACMLEHYTKKSSCSKYTILEARMQPLALCGISGPHQAAIFKADFLIRLRGKLCQPKFCILSFNHFSIAIFHCFKTPFDSFDLAAPQSCEVLKQLHLFICKHCRLTRRQHLSH